MAAIVPAAGCGSRFKTKRSKVFFPVFGTPLLVVTLKNLLRSHPFKEIVVLAQKNDILRMTQMLQRHGLKRVRVEEGGATRADSVKKGLAALRSDPRWILIHDAARPLVSKDVVRRTLSAAKRTGAAICALEATSTVKRVAKKSDFISGTEDRRTLWLAQTPQVFRQDLLLGRYRDLGRRAFSATDEAALFDGSRVRVRIVEGNAKNIKVTTKEDLKLMKYYLGRFPCA